MCTAHQNKNVSLLSHSHRSVLRFFDVPVTFSLVIRSGEHTIIDDYTRNLLNVLIGRILVDLFSFQTGTIVFFKKGSNDDAHAGHQILTIYWFRSLSESFLYDGQLWLIRYNQKVAIASQPWQVADDFLGLTTPEISLAHLDKGSKK